MLSSSSAPILGRGSTYNGGVEKEDESSEDEEEAVTTGSVTPRTAYAKKKGRAEQTSLQLVTYLNPKQMERLEAAFARSPGSAVRLEEFVQVVQEVLPPFLFHQGSDEAAAPCTKKKSRKSRLGRAVADRVDAPDPMDGVHNLIELFEEIDVNGDGTVEWDEFTRFIVEKARVFNELNALERIPAYRHVELPCEEGQRVGRTRVEEPRRHRNLIDRIVRMPDQQLLAVTEQHSNVVQTYSATSGAPGPSFKTGAVPLALTYAESQQSLFVACSDVTMTTYQMVPDVHSQVPRFKETSRWPTPDTVMCLCWSDAQKTAYGGVANGGVLGWSDDSSAPKAELAGHTDMVMDVLHVPYLDNVVSASLDSTVRVWDTYTEEQTLCLRGHGKGVTKLAYNPEHRFLISAGFDHDALVWSPFVSTLLCKLKGHRAALVSCEAVGGTHELVTGDSEGILKVWDLRTFGCVQTFTASSTLKSTCVGNEHQGDLDNLAGFQALAHCRVDESTSRLVAGTKKLFFFDQVRDRKEPVTGANLARVVVLNQVDMTILVVEDRLVQVWDAVLGTLKKSYPDPADGRDLSAACLDDRRRKFFLGTVAGDVTCHNYANGARMKTLPSFDHPFLYVASPSSSSRRDKNKNGLDDDDDDDDDASPWGQPLSERGRRRSGSLLSKKKKKKRPTDDDSNGTTSNGTTRGTVSVAVAALAYLDRAKAVVAACASGMVRVIDERDPEVCVVLRQFDDCYAHRREVCCFANSLCPEWCLAATASVSGAEGIRIWNAETAKCDSVLKCQGVLVLAMGFLDPLPVLYACTSDGLVGIWLVEPGSELNGVCLLAFPNRPPDYSEYETVLQGRTSESSQRPLICTKTTTAHGDAATLSRPRLLPPEYVKAALERANVEHVAPVVREDSKLPEGVHSRPSPVSAAAWSSTDLRLYLGDELGNLRCFDLGDALNKIRALRLDAKKGLKEFSEFCDAEALKENYALKPHEISAGCAEATIDRPVSVDELLESPDLNRLKSLLPPSWARFAWSVEYAHEDAVTHLSAEADPRAIISAGIDRCVKMWDVRGFFRGVLLQGLVPGTANPWWSLDVDVEAREGRDRDRVKHVTELVQQLNASPDTLAASGSQSPREKHNSTTTSGRPGLKFGSGAISTTSEKMWDETSSGEPRPVAKLRSALEVADALANDPDAASFLLPSSPARSMPSADEIELRERVVGALADVRDVHLDQHDAVAQTDALSHQSGKLLSPTSPNKLLGFGRATHQKKRRSGNPAYDGVASVAVSLGGGERDDDRSVDPDFDPAASKASRSFLSVVPPLPDVSSLSAQAQTSLDRLTAALALADDRDADDAGGGACSSCGCDTQRD